MIVTSTNRRLESLQVVCRLSPLQRSLKRSADIVGAILCLLLTSPVLLLTALAVKINDGGSIFFLQERVGMGGKTFKIIKFRSLHQQEGEGLTPVHDKDLSRFGRWLRRHHLDELPQLWNVLRGDMSFVGYRPERKVYIEQIMQHDSRYECLYQLRPGLTSEATIYNGYTDTMDKMLNRLTMDLQYLEEVSFTKDISLIFKTISVVFKGK